MFNLTQYKQAKEDWTCDQLDLQFNNIQTQKIRPIHCINYPLNHLLTLSSYIFVRSTFRMYRFNAFMVVKINLCVTNPSCR